MAARTVAAAYNGSSLSVLYFFFTLLFTFLFVSTTQGNNCYSRQALLDVGFHRKSPVTADFHCHNNIPDEIARPPGSPWIVISCGRRRRRRRERKQKRGRRSGLLARLRKDPHKLPLPSMFLSNARSLTHKMDELELLANGNRYVRDCCVSVISETWLHPSIPDAAVQLGGRTVHRWDRNKDSGKSRGGGLCIFIHNSWSINTTSIDTHCSRT